MVEDFPCRPTVQDFGGGRRWRALEILPRWKPGGPGGSYGESMARFVSVDAIRGGSQRRVDEVRAGFGVVF